MRDYGFVYTRFWTHSAMQPLSDQAKLLAVYLLTSAHTTMLGCFRLPLGYLMDDLGWSMETVKKRLAELSAQGFLTFDARRSWLLIHHFLKWNPVENPNQGRSIVKLFTHIPEDSTVWKPLVGILHTESKYLEEGFTKRLATLSKGFRNQEQEQEQEQDTGDRKQEQETGSRSQEQKQEEQDEERGVHPPIVAPARRSEGPPPPILAVFDFWKTTLGHPQAVLDEKRKQLIQQALKWGYRVDQLRDAIRGCSLTPYNMGSNERGQRYDGLHVILKNADQIDRFIRNDLNPPQPQNAAYRLLEGNIVAGKRWLERKKMEVQYG